MVETKPGEEEEVDLTLESVDKPACQTWMGVFAAQSLKTFGCAVFYVGEDGGVRMANPAGVYIQPGADEGMPGRAFKWVRPIVGGPQPRYIGWRDGQAWEIVLEEEDLEAKGEPNASDDQEAGEPRSPSSAR